MWLVYALAAIGAVAVLLTGRAAVRWWRRMRNAPSIFDRKQWMPR
jgi:hypothetical protein